MERKINLQQDKTRDEVYESRPVFFWQSALLLIILGIVAGALFFYSLILSNKLNGIKHAIEENEKRITALKNVEEAKSLLTLKTSEIEKLYSNRLDYVKALQRIERLFGDSLDIHEIELKNDKTGKVQATKIKDITILESETEQFPLTELTIDLDIASSSEIQKTLDNLRQYLSENLIQVILLSSSLREEGGYEMSLKLVFKANETNTDNANTTNEETAY
jgi:hypothetical protein